MKVSVRFHAEVFDVYLDKDATINDLRKAIQESLGMDLVYIHALAFKQSRAEGNIHDIPGTIAGLAKQISHEALTDADEISVTVSTVLNQPVSLSSGASSSGSGSAPSLEMTMSSRSSATEDPSGMLLSLAKKKLDSYLNPGNIFETAFRSHYDEVKRIYNIEDFLVFMVELLNINLKNNNGKLANIIRSITDDISKIDYESWKTIILKNKNQIHYVNALMRKIHPDLSVFIKNGGVDFIFHYLMAASKSRQLMMDFLSVIEDIPLEFIKEIFTRKDDKNKTVITSTFYSNKAIKDKIFQFLGRLPAQDMKYILACNVIHEIESMTSMFDLVGDIIHKIDFMKKHTSEAVVQEFYAEILPAIMWAFRESLKRFNRKESAYFREILLSLPQKQQIAVLTSLDREGNNPLMLAVTGSYLEIPYLIECISALPDETKNRIVEQQNADGENMLVLAAKYHPQTLLELIEFLQKLKAKLVARKILTDAIAPIVGALVKALENHQRDTIFSLIDIVETFFPRDRIAQVMSATYIRRWISGNLLQIAVTNDAPLEVFRRLLDIMINFSADDVATILWNEQITHEGTGTNRSLITALTRNNPEKLALLLDFMTRYGKQLPHVLSNTDREGWNFPMRLIQPRIPEEHQKMILDFLETLPGTSRIAVLSQVSHNGWNLLMLVAENAPVLITQLLAIIGRLPKTHQQDILRQKTHDGWMPLKVAAHHHPETIPEIAAFVRTLQDPELERQLVIDASGTIGRAMHKALQEGNHALFNTLLNGVICFDSILQRRMLSEKDAEDNNILMAAAIHGNLEIVSTLIAIIMEMEPIDRQELLLRENRQNQGMLPLMAHMRHDERYKDVLSQLLRSMDSTRETPSSPLPPEIGGRETNPESPPVNVTVSLGTTPVSEASPGRFRFHRPAREALGPVITEELIGQVIPFMNALSGAEWSVQRIDGEPRLVSLILPGPECTRVSLSLMSGSDTNPTYMDFHQLVSKERSGGFICFSFKLNALASLLQEHGVLAEALPVCASPAA